MPSESLNLFDFVLSEIQLCQIGNADGHKLRDFIIAEHEISERFPSLLHIEGFEILDVVVVGDEGGQIGQQCD